jgi:C1A family cysteine protease
MPAVYDQGSIGSCSGQAIAAALEYDRAKQGLDVWTPSRLFIYYYERYLENSVASDSGATLRDGFKVVNSNGFCKETTWPYFVNQFATQPSQVAIDEAKKYTVVKYQSVDQTPQAIQNALTSGYPICFGISVYESFESNQVAINGVVPMPSIFESSLGGHAILLVGKIESKKQYIFRNSWGTAWGDGGYGYLPYNYVHSNKLASDFWVAETLSA